MKPCSSCGKQIDDKWAQCFGCKFPEKAKQGFTGVKVTETPFGKQVDKPRENTMRKMNSLNNAVQVLRVMTDVGVLAKEQASPQEALRIANQFLDWINVDE